MAYQCVAVAYWYHWSKAAPPGHALPALPAACKRALTSSMHCWTICWTSAIVIFEPATIRCHAPAHLALYLLRSAVTMATDHGLRKEMATHFQVHQLPQEIYNVLYQPQAVACL